jgi:hypothetical protein
MHKMSSTSASACDMAVYGQGVVDVLLDAQCKNDLFALILADSEIPDARHAKSPI